LTAAEFRVQLTRRIEGVDIARSGEKGALREGKDPDLRP
jgi:hypothetical protein